MVLCAVFGGYVLLSLILLKYPNLIHKRKQLKFRARHISHRGGAAEHLENTMEAFQFAAALGTDMLELDCQLTRDGQVVVCHDDDLQRTCNSRLEISRSLYSQLPPLKERIKVEFCNTLTGCGEDRRIPLLREVFEQFPGLPVNIDIKVDNDVLIQQVDSLVREFDREEITAWGNRSDQVCQKLYSINPRVPLIFSMQRVLHLLALFWTGLLPFVPLKESLLEIIMPSILIDQEHQFDFRMNLRSRVLCWLIDKLLMRPALFQHLERRGIQTYVWVLNTEKDFDRAFNLGAAGVMTDRITLLKEYLDHKSVAPHDNHSGGDHNLLSE